MSVGAKGRGITRPARSAQRGGRPGKPLRPVKRTALRGGTGGSLRWTRALRAWPGQSQGRLACPNPPGPDHRAPRGDPRIIFSVEAFQPAAPLLAAGLAWRRAGRAVKRAKGSEPPCGKVRPHYPTARPVDHRLTLDPCGLAYSLLRPPASTPKVVPTRGWITGLPRKRSSPEGPRLDRWIEIVVQRIWWDIAMRRMRAVL